jgi:hypothetical protein
MRGQNVLRILRRKYVICAVETGGEGVYHFSSLTLPFAIICRL